MNRVTNQMMKHKKIMVVVDQLLDFVDFVESCPSFLPFVVVVLR